ncbi:MAG TPA: TonB-dependent receptor [Vicinamibacteria bacterium]|nr:TonB-dependent receptor [Vicinamibacteria bacterium]
MLSRKLGLISFFIVLGVNASFAQERGKVVGSVIDEFNAMTLPMAPVAVVDSDTVVYTDLDGKYTLELDPGTYQLKVAFAGYQEKTVSVTVERGRTITVDVPVSMERFTEEVTVTAEAETPQLFTAEAQLIERKKAVVISDNLAAEDMRKNADSNAASAMQRVTGLTVVDGQYVFVRGLGERYSNTQLNGATLPTTEPEKKVVPLDLFPSGLIQSVQVQKTYMPDKPADFTGGLVEIEPLNFPDSQVFDFSLSYGFNGRTTFENHQTYPGGNTDFLGFDDGTRALPTIIPTDEKVVRSGGFTDTGFTPDELTTFGRSFANVWQPRLSSSAAPNQSYSLVWGNSTEKLGAVFSFAYNYKNQNQTEVQNFYKVSGEEITLQNDYDFEISSTDTTMGMVGNLAYKINGNNRLAFENFYTNNSSNETRVFQGFNKDINTELLDSRLYWVQESIYSGKVSGEHYLPGLSSSRIDWRTTFSRAVRDEPDLRETLYEYNPSIDQFVLADESQSGFRMFNDLNDNVTEVGADWSTFTTQWSGLPMMIKVGPYVQFRDRDFSSRRFRFRPLPTRIDISQPPEVLFAEENIGTAFELREETRATDTYTADQTISAGYGMIDLPFTERVRFVGGVRVERSEQNVTTFDLFALDPQTIVSNLDDTDILPGLNVIYSLTGEQNLRFGFSRTVNRPEFRELAPFEFTDVVGGRATVGNPDLQRALISNYDVRWEWFPGASEVIAASVFYKDFQNPIERTVQATAQLRTSYANAEAARNTGFELEARKQLTPFALLSANYTYVDSDIDIGRGMGEVQTSTNRPLAGQSANVFNVAVELLVPGVDFSTRILYNYFDDRIIDVGSLGLPDILEDGRGSLDVVAIKRFGPTQFRFIFDNLTDADYRFSQGGELQRLFKLGRTFAVSFSYSLF